MTYTSGTMTTTYANNVVVSGNINSVPYAKFAYLTGITSDVQTQINAKANTTDLTTTNANLTALQTLVNVKANVSDLVTANANITTLQAKTTYIAYNGSTLTTTHGGNLVVSGNINSVPSSKFAYLTNITADVQAQINSKSPTASPTFTGTINSLGNIIFNNSTASNNQITQLYLLGFDGSYGSVSAPMEKIFYLGVEEMLVIILWA